MHVHIYLDKYSKYITSSNKPYGIHRPRKNKFFENEKLIFKIMFKKSEIAYDSNQHYVGMSCSTIIQKNNKYNLKFLLGILNSNFGLYWFYKTGKRRGVGVDIGVQKLREFPICKYNEEKIQNLIALVDKITEEYTFNDERNEMLENEINDIVYKLYGLSDEQISKIEEACNQI